MRKYWNIAKWVGGIGFLILLICGGGAAFLYPQVKRSIEQRQESSRGTLVIVEPASFGQLTRTVSAPGTISAKTTTNISSRVSARINSIMFEEGDTVKEGDVLLELDSLEYVAALDASKARYAADEANLKSIEASYAAEEARIIGARAQYQNALVDLERQQELFKSGDVSKSILDNAQTEVERLKSLYDASLKGLDAARANVDAGRARAAASRAEVDRAQRNLDYCTVRAPFSGLITRRIAQVGETALGTVQNVGTQLMVLEDVTEILVKARLAETDSPRVSNGQKVKVYVNGYPDTVFEGVLRRIGMTSLRWTADNTFYFEAEIVLETNGVRISSGTTANVEIEIETLDNVLIVPSQAVLDKRVDSLPQKLRESSDLIDRDKTFARIVLTMKDGKAVYTPVRVIASSITRTAIAEGLSEDDPVITGPFKALQDLSDGAMVRTEKEEAKPKEPETSEVAEKEKSSDAKSEPKPKSASAG